VPHPQAPGAPAKKKSLHATERETPRVQQARTAYRQRTAALDLRRLKFVDEAGVNLAMTRLYGRAPKGERVIGTVPQNYGENITMLGAIGLHGMQAVMTVHGATELKKGHHWLFVSIGSYQKSLAGTLAGTFRRYVFLPCSGSPALSPIARR
jgi:DDE superfamily endonuclease